MATNANRRQFLKEMAVAGLATQTGLWTANALAAEPAGATKKRVFVAQFMHETNTFHPLRTTRFEYRPPLAGWKTPGLKVWEGTELTMVPGVGATPDGGGLIEEQPCREAIARIVKSLREKLPVDGVFLHLHGAMFADGVGPGETVLTEQIRRVVGPKVPIACTFDLHGNISPRLADVGDILVGFKTAPHIDRQETAEHAGRLLLETLRGNCKPVSYIVPIPMLFPGEMAMTTGEPLRSLVDQARKLERDGLPGHDAKILAATIFVSCYVTDSPNTHMTAMVTADGSRETARAAAIHLARLVWDARKQFHYGCETASLEEGVARALAAKESTVFLTDSGDNVTASAPGDLPIVLRHLVERGVKNALVANLYDEAATRRCFEAGQGSRLRLSIGATVEKRHGPPLEAEVEVVRLVNGSPRMAVVRIGGVEAVLQESSAEIVDPAQFKPLGIDPLSRKIVVVKEGYLYPKLTEIAPRHIMLLTPGASDLRIEKLDYVRRPKPMFPFEPDMTFDPEKSA
ncbi:MAG: M81 family metallopeptidase [Planctomycetaceae bacterium]|nr:M81 family metallopeptidase [Planctomycetaceae bacterium]